MPGLLRRLLHVVAACAACSWPSAAEAAAAAAAASAFAQQRVLPPSVTFTVAGHSSGGGMASNHLLAFSDRVTGMGQIESGCYAEGRVEQPPAFGTSIQGPFPPFNLSGMVNYARRSAAIGRIAPLAGMSRARVWLMQGGNDTVCRNLPNLSASFYRKLLPQVVLKIVPGAEHGFVTDQSPTCASCVPCGTLGGMVQLCGFDMAGSLLQHVLGETLIPRVQPLPQNLRTINQSQFWPSDAKTREAIGMDYTAYTYVPSGCLSNSSASCRIHVVYPGCYCSVATSPPGRPSTGLDIIQYGGFNDWAESNRIIVLYPQHAVIACWQGCGRSLPSNPNYDLYDTRLSRQLSVVNRMVDWLSEGDNLSQLGSAAPRTGTVTLGPPLAAPLTAFFQGTGFMPSRYLLHGPGPIDCYKTWAQSQVLACRKKKRKLCLSLNVHTF